MTATAAVLRQRASAAASTLAARIAALDWTQIAQALDAHGCATTGALLTSDECNQLAASYASPRTKPLGFMFCHYATKPLHCSSNFPGS